MSVTTTLDDYTKQWQDQRTKIMAVALFVAPMMARFGFNVDAQLIGEIMIVVGPTIMWLMKKLTDAKEARKTAEIVSKVKVTEARVDQLQFANDILVNQIATGRDRAVVNS